LKKYGDPTFYRFLVAGGLNTGLTYLIYLALLYLMSYVWAYTVTFVIGIAVGYLLNAKWVYRKEVKVGAATAYCFVYLGNYFLGVSLLYIFVELFEISMTLAPIGVVSLSVPIMYFLTRKLVFKYS
jgi:putative flippase GtrA